MCYALPGQVDCKRAGCSLPIHVEANGRRHPYCSIECARACGEVPRSDGQPVFTREYISVKLNSMKSVYRTPISSDNSDIGSQGSNDD
ncbi:hypothetical protein FBU30_000513 [Linnemannia zychae]|nr:hypothetical protein FBU30_000513 [Linnemannia zychae]